METIVQLLVGSLYTGIFGDHLDSKTKEIRNKILGQFISQKSPVNHDIERAVYRAYLQSTLIVAEHLLDSEKKTIGWTAALILRNDAAWYDEVASEIRQELIILDKPDFIPALLNSTNIDIALLLRPFDNTIGHKVQNLRQVLEGAILAMLEAKFNKVPEAFRQCIREGWEQEGTADRQLWFSYVCAFFADELKRNNRLQGIFQGQILADLHLADIPLNLKTIQAGIEQLVAQAYPDFSDITNRLDRMESLLHKISLPAEANKLQYKGAEMEGSAQLQEDQIRHSPELLRKYLQWMQGKYGGIRLPAIRENAGIPELPLDRIYVALRVRSKSTAMDIANAYRQRQRRIKMRSQEAGILLDAEQLQQISEQVDQENPMPRSLADLGAQLLKAGVEVAGEEPLDANNANAIKETVDEKTGERIISLGTAFCEESNLVILGDPGSGKSTLAKWLTIHLARSMREHMDTPENDRVKVKAGQVDMDQAESNAEIDLGPCRLPVFVTIADYSQFYATTNVQQRGIIDYLGMSVKEWDDATKAECNKMIRHYLTLDQAVIILDGMDEVVGNRADILREIEYFQKVWIECCGKSDTDQEDDVPYKPGEEGGNQLVVTSRVVGYHAAPLSGEFRVMTVEKMSESAVRHFCDLWMEQVVRLENPNFGESEIKLLAQTAANALKSEIYDPKRPAIKDLATNPLLVTNLAMVFRFRNGHLPDSRAELYEQTLTILLQKWRTTSLKESEMRFVLAPLAAEIHAKPGDDIRESELRTLIRHQLALARVVKLDELPMSFDEEVEHFIGEIRQNVGLIAERGDKLYHFLHRTFQEYLSAMYLIGNRRYAPSEEEIDKAVQQIQRYWDDPIWHEVVLLALGIVDSFWSPKEAGRLFSELLLQEDPLRDLLPRTALFLAKAIPEMQQISDELVAALLNQLLIAYNGVAFGEGTSVLTGEIESAVERLFYGARGDVVRNEFGKIFGNNKGETLRVGALHLANQKQLWSGEWSMPLSDYMAQDEGSWNTDADALLKRQFSNVDQSLAPKIRIRERLIANQEQWQFVMQNPDWVRLITVFFGGWAPDPDIDRYVALEEQRYGLFVKETNGSGDSDAQNRLAQLFIPLEEKKLPEFSPVFVYREAPFTKEILQALVQRQPAIELINFFQARWEANASDNESVYALLGMLALGADITPQLAALEKDHDLRPVFDRFIHHLDRLEQLVRYPAIALSLFLRKNKKAFFEAPGLRSIPSDKRKDVLETINKIAVRAKLAGNQFSYTNVHYAVWCDGNEPDSWPQYLQACYWASMTSSIAESPVYSTAVELDVSSPTLSRDPELLLKSLLYLPQLVQMKVPYRYPWPMNRTLFVPRTEFECVRQALGIVLELDDDYDFLREWFVFALQPFYEKYPQLLPYALAVGYSENTGFRLAQLPSDVFKSGDAIENLLREISALDSPGDRFWAYYPIARRDPNAGVFFQMLEDWNHITDARDRLEGMYYLLELLVSGKFSSPKVAKITKNEDGVLNSQIDTLQNVLIDAVDGAIKNLKNPSDQLRANLYLAELDGNKDKEGYVFKSMGFIPALQGDGQRRQDLLAILDKFPEIATNFPDWPSINKSFTSVWDRNIALQKNFLNLITLDDLISGKSESEEFSEEQNGIQKLLPGIWAGVTLFECCANLRKRFRTELFSAGRFQDLTDPDKRDETLQHILRIGAVQQHRIGRTIVTVINRLLQTGDRATISSLLPVLGQPEIDAWPFMKEWGKTDWPLFRQFYQLLRAEAGQYDSDSIVGIADMLSANDDGLRGRATLALNGDRFGVGNEKIRTSCIGWETMVVLGERTMQEKNASISQVLRWTNHNVFYDSPEFIDHCVEFLKSPDKNKQVLASKLLRGINVLSYQVWQNLVFHLCSSDSRQVKLEVMVVLGTLATRMGWDHFAWMPQAWNQLFQVITDEHWNIFSSEERFYDLTYDKIVEALRTADKLEGANSYSKIACVKAALTELTRIPVEHLKRSTTIELFYAFKKIGASFFIDTDDFQKQALAASQLVRDEPQLLPILFDWTLSILDDELLDWDLKDYHFGGELALLAATLAEQLSDSFSEMVQRGYTQTMLLEVGKTHPYWIARQSALVLLTCLQPMHSNTIQVLESAMQDVSIVQKEAIRCIPHFRNVVDQQVINRLVQNLAHPSGILGRSSAQILTAIAVNDQFNYSLRRQVAEALAQQIRTIRAEPAMQRLIFILYDNDNSRKQFTYDGNLESALLIEMMKVSGHL